MSAFVQKGQKADITKISPKLDKITIKVEWKAKDASSNNFEIDVAAFLLNASGKAARDEDFVFYNNSSGGAGSVLHMGKANVPGYEEVRINLKKLPALIERIAFTITMHNAVANVQSFNQIDNISVRVCNEDTKEEIISYLINDAFTVETAIVAAEIYRYKGEWKFNAIGSGFEGGLGALCGNFGLSVEDSEPREEQKHQIFKEILQSKVPSSEGKDQVEASQLKSGKSAVNLSKIDLLKRKVDIVLEKKKIIGTVARVALVMDISGSMRACYKKGTVQNVVDRIAAVAARFDDDGNLDMWIFDHRYHRMPPVNENNYENYIKQEILDKYKDGAFSGKIFGANDEPPVMRDVIEFYTKENISKDPAFIVFISDGGVHKNAEIKKLMIEASNYPLFWQFVGIGNAKYGILENLDTMPGRVVDNANFFSLDDIDSISDEELYNKLLNEFPAWLVEVRAKGILK